jgi:hypothetical protein
VRPDENVAEMRRLLTASPAKVFAAFADASLVSLYEKAFAIRHGRLWTKAFAYGAAGAMLSWSFTTLAVAAKNVMASVPDYLLIETAFTLVQWTLVAPLTVLAFRQPRNATGAIALHGSYTRQVMPFDDKLASRIRHELRQRYGAVTGNVILPLNQD